MSIAMFDYQISPWYCIPTTFPYLYHVEKTYVNTLFNFPWHDRNIFPCNVQYTTMFPMYQLKHGYGKAPLLMGKSTISMAIFNSFLYVYQRVISLMLNTQKKKKSNPCAAVPSRPTTTSSWRTHGRSSTAHLDPNPCATVFKPWHGGKRQ